MISHKKDLWFQDGQYTKIGGIKRDKNYLLVLIAHGGEDTKLTLKSKNDYQTYDANKFDDPNNKYIFYSLGFSTDAQNHYITDFQIKINKKTQGELMLFEEPTAKKYSGYNKNKGLTNLMKQMNKN